MILEKKTGIKSEIKENFSRVADSFYPMLYTELFKKIIVERKLKKIIVEKNLFLKQCLSISLSKAMKRF